MQTNQIPYRTVPLMRLPFALAAFSAAALLFAVQPMAGKAVLPTFGGSPAVWTTCLLFFQAVLLLGYLYAHAISRFSVRVQVAIHACVLILGGAARLAANQFGWADAEFFPDWPVPGVLTRLAALAFGPAFALSATAPLIQRWFAAGWPGKNPYVLYAASNAGSLLGLLSYPFLIEPRWDLLQQAEWWLVGYGVAGGLILFCGLFSPSLEGRGWGLGEDAPPNPPAPFPQGKGEQNPVYWLALAALPSSLLSSVTSHLTTDIAPVPLLWVVPLAIYLISYIVAFGRWSARSQRWLGRVMPMALTFLVVALLTRATEPVIAVGAIHLVAFFLVATLCHGELARTKPDASRLTSFYLWISLGGVLGGFFNAIVAPIIFSRLGPVEYPLAVCLAALVRPPEADDSRPRWIGWDDLKWLIGLAAIAFTLILLVPGWLPIEEGLDDGDLLLKRVVRYGLTAGVPAAIAFALVWRPGRFAVSLAILFLANSFDPGRGKPLTTLRNSLGTLRVSESADGKFVQITHGTTLHGQQFKNEDGPPKPLMYYHPTGPAGRLLNSWPAERRKTIGAVGLGCGALAGYGKPGETWTFFELDPNVIRVAEGPKYFTFLSTCQAKLRVVPGDARLKLQDEPDGSFDLLILDAFNSDAVPTHLLTKEAFDLYFRKLTPHGVLLIHASNRYLDLPGLIVRTAEGMAVKQDFDMPTESQKEDGKFTSHWLVVARTMDDLVTIAKDFRWQKTEPKPGPVWTDRFTDLLGIWKKSED
jgi:hypothetical protein